MSLTREQVLHIARLARVGVTEEDVARLQEQLSEILEHFEALRALDTEGVPPTSHPHRAISIRRSIFSRMRLTRDGVALTCGTHTVAGRPTSDSRAVA